MSMLPSTQRPVAHYNVNVRINNWQLADDADGRSTHVWFDYVRLHVKFRVKVDSKATDDSGW